MFCLSFACLGSLKCICPGEKGGEARWALALAAGVWLEARALLWSSVVRDARELFSGGARSKCRPLEWTLKADSISERAMMLPY